MRASVQELIHYRGVIKQLVIRDLKLRYERSALGFLWSLLNPLAMIGIYTFFFSLVVRMGIDRYAIFLVSVLLPWTFLTRSLLSVAPLTYQNGYLLNRAAFPAEALVFSGMISTFIDFCLEMSIFVLILLIIGAPVFPGLLILPFAMVLLFLFASGVALIFSVANVLFRDTQYVAGLIATSWLYLTPVFYPVTLVPEQYRSLYQLNPMVHIAGVFREPLYAANFPAGATVFAASVVAIGFFTLGYMFFNKYKRDFAELV
jgi:lipopolysaccharide transport system permease protein